MEQIRGAILTFAFSLALAIGPGTGATPVFAADEPPVVDGETGSDQQNQKDIEDVEPVELLLDRLSRAESRREAKALEREIVMAWSHSGSDTIDLLLSRANQATKEEDYGLALQYLDTIVDLKPDFAEGWNMRATIYYLIDEYELSMADIQHVLALQPRHFGALSGLGMIFRDLDEPAKALDAFRQVLAVHPYFGNARETIEKLEPEVEGRDI